jgi:ParB-like chromosome segregation protein Spo0J
MTTATTSEKTEKFRRVDVSQKTGFAHPNEFKTTKIFKDLLLPLSEADFSAFASQVKQDGRIINPIIVDEDMVILDGHHRLEAATKSGLTTISYEMVTGLSQEEKIELIYATNLNRRQLSLEQMKEVCEERFTNFMKLCEQNPQDWTPERIADLTGKSVEVVRNRLKGQGIPVPDRRTTLTKQDVVEIKKFADAQKPYAEIAAHFGVSKGRISQVVNAQPKPKAAPAQKAAAAGTAIGPFVESWPAGKKEQATLIGEIKSACSVGSMAVAVVPVDLIEDVENLIHPEQIDVDENDIDEADADRFDDEADDWDQEIDDGESEISDEDQESLKGLYGDDADDEEDDHEYGI